MSLLMIIPVSFYQTRVGSTKIHLLKFIFFFSLRSVPHQQWRLGCVNVKKWFVMMMDWLGKKPSKDANHSSISSSLLEVSSHFHHDLDRLYLHHSRHRFERGCRGPSGDATGRPRGKNGRLTELGCPARMSKRIMANDSWVDESEY